MAKSDRFTFALDEEERRLLNLLAHEMRRTQADALRLLIHLAASGLADPSPQEDLMPPVSMYEADEVPF